MLPSTEPSKSQRCSGLTVVLVGIIVAGLTIFALQYQPTIHELPTSLVCAEQFGPDWTSRWHIDEGSVAIEGGKVTATATGATIMRLKRRLEAPFVIEYTGTLAKDAPAGDISLILWRDPGLSADGSIADQGMRLMVQLGAYEGSYSAIMHADAKRYEQVTASPFRPLPGHSYRVRVTVIEQDIRVFVDGQEIMHHHDPLPMIGVSAGLFSYYTGKTFSDIQVWSRQNSLALHPTSVGDAFLIAGDAQRALATYESMVATTSGDLLTEVRYKQGLALDALERKAEARGAWLAAGQDDNKWGLAARLAFMDVWALDGNGGVGSKELERAWADPAMRPLVEQAWSRWVYRAASAQDVPAVDRWLAVRERLFPQSFATEHVAADALMMTARPALVVTRFPQQDRLAAVAFLQMGKPAEVLTRYPQQRGAAAEALLALGRGKEIEQRYPEQSRWIRLYGLRSGMAAQLVEEPTTEAGALARLWRDGPSGVSEAASERVRVLADAHAVRWKNVALAHAADSGDRAAAAFAFGQVVTDPIWSQWTALAETPVPAEPIAENAARSDLRLARARWLLWPALHPELPIPACQDSEFLGQRPGAWMKRLSGEQADVSDQRFAAADDLLIQAIRADRVKEHSTAEAHYRAWLALPSWRRDETADPVAEAVVKKLSEGERH